MGIERQSFIRTLHNLHSEKKTEPTESQKIFREAYLSTSAADLRQKLAESLGDKALAKKIVERRFDR